MRKICELESMPDKKARVFPYNDERTMILYREGETAYAYVNSCPHTGVSLEWSGNDSLMSLDGNDLQCSTHGALFETRTGLCVWGPCTGAYLEKIEVVTNDGVVYLSK